MSDGPSLFHHAECGAAWTLPNDAETAICPNCDTRVERISDEAAKMVQLGSYLESWGVRVSP